MSEAVNEPAEPQPLEQPETPNAPERGLLIFNHPDGTSHGWGDADDPSVGGVLADGHALPPTPVSKEI